MFEKVDSINNKKINNLDKKIQHVESEIIKLESKMSIDLELGEYAAISSKIDAYKQYISKCEEEKQYIKNNQYTKEDVALAAKEIKKEYNPKLKKSLIEIVNISNSLINKYDEYLKINSDFISTRDEFNRKCMVANVVGSVYDGTDMIVNDCQVNLEALVRNVKQIIGNIDIK